MEERRAHPDVVNVLRLSLDFESDMMAVFDGATTGGTPRSKLSTIFLDLSHEHWLSLRVLMGDGLNHLAIGLLRLQFEATLKGFWVKFAATDHWIERAGVIREFNGHLVEPELPKVGEMLKDVERTAPEGRLRSSTNSRPLPGDSSIRMCTAACSHWPTSVGNPRPVSGRVNPGTDITNGLFRSYFHVSANAGPQ
jgi:hypothetical protein